MDLDNRDYSISISLYCNLRPELLLVWGSYDTTLSLLSLSPCFTVLSLCLSLCIAAVCLLSLRLQPNLTKRAHAGAILKMQGILTVTNLKDRPKMGSEVKIRRDNCGSVLSMMC